MDPSGCSTITAATHCMHAAPNCSSQMLRAPSFMRCDTPQRHTHLLVLRLFLLKTTLLAST